MEYPRNKFISYSKICICGYKLLIIWQSFEVPSNDFLRYLLVSAVCIVCIWALLRKSESFHSKIVCLSPLLSLCHLKINISFCVSSCGLHLDFSFILTTAVKLWSFRDRYTVQIKQRLWDESYRVYVHVCIWVPVGLFLYFDNYTVSLEYNVA